MRIELKLISFFLVLSVLCTNCGPAGFQSSVNSIYKFNPIPGTIGGNIISLKVGCGYKNMLCASVQLCSPSAPATCVTLNNLLLDTGSTGLRVFASKITGLGTLHTQTDAFGNSVGACAIYGDGSYHWGSLQLANLVLGTESAILSTPIQVIDYTFGDSGATCRASSGASVIPDAAATGYDGILGIKFFQHDCGSSCVTNPGTSNPLYIACNGVNCGYLSWPVSSQIRNPIAALAGDNNGYIIDMLPALSISTSATVAGSLIFGIGTQANNSPDLNAVTKLSVEPTYGSIKATFNGATVAAIVDSGSNANFFQYSGMATCATFTSFFCPVVSPTTFPISLVANSGPIRVDTSITVDNGDTLYAPANTNIAFSNLAGPIPVGLTGFFDFGLSFFFGRRIYYGLESSPTSLGDGPYLGL